jgi:hypothetical protein
LNIENGELKIKEHGQEQNMEHGRKTMNNEQLILNHRRPVETGRAPSLHAGVGGLGRGASLCNSVNLRVTLCQKIVTQSYTEKTQSYTEKKKPPNPRMGKKLNIENGELKIKEHGQTDNRQ